VPENIDPATGTSPTTNAPDTWSLTPDQATAQLAAMQAAYDASGAPAAPTAEQVQDAYDARLRLTALTNDPVWARRYMQGCIPEKREFEALTEMIANDAEATGVLEAPIETTVEGGIRRQDLISEIDHLGKVGIPDEGIVAIATGNFSEADVEWAQGWLEKGLATKEWTDALLRGDPTVLHEWTALCGVIASGKVA
jgi:hypothetical protein